MHRPRLLALALALAGACSLPAAASTLELASLSLASLLEIEVSGNSKFELGGTTPAAASVITAEDIRVYGFRTLAQALQSVRGVLTGSDRSYATIAVRGFSAPANFNNRVLLLIDGIRVNDTVDDQALLGSEFPLDLDLVERIEFIPGQGSAVHGANAVFGVINVVTRDAAAGPDWQFATRHDSEGTQAWRATRRLGAGRGHLLLSATLRRDPGGSLDYQTREEPPAEGRVDGADRDRGAQLYARYDDADLSATLLHARRDKRFLGGGGPMRLGDPANLYQDRETLGSISLRRPLGASELWKTRLYAGSYAFTGWYAVDLAPGALDRDHTLARWWGLESTLSTTRWAGHQAGVGFDLRRSPRMEQFNALVRPAGIEPFLDARRSGSNLALFVEDRYTPAPGLTLDAGLRYDAAGGAGRLSPRLALTGQPSAALRATLSWGSSFRPPSGFEAWYVFTDPALGPVANPALHGERVRGTDLTVEWRARPQQRWVASVYDTRSDDLIGVALDPADGVPKYLNGYAMRLRGAEAGFDQSWPGGMRLQASYALLHARERLLQDPPQRRIVRLAKASAAIPLGRGLSLGLQARHDSALYEGAPAETRLDATLAANLPQPRVRVSLGIANLFDRNPPQLMPMLDGTTRASGDGRRVFVAAEASF